MKKSILLLSLSLGMTSFAFAQSVWTGTTVPTTTTGSVGVGTTAPTAKLHIYSSNNAGGLGPALTVGSANGFGIVDPTTGAVTSIYPNAMEVINYAKNILGGGWTPSLDFSISTGGVVAVKKSLRIGATAANGAYANYKLSVDGDMIAKRCVIQVSNWADYVFDPNYSMPSLSELETYVNTNKHLPGVPSAAEVADKGVEMGEMNKILLQKVEELTLYTIKQQKEIDALKNQMSAITKSK